LEAKREENQRMAFSFMLSALGVAAIDTTLFDSDKPPFAETILPTTWEDLGRADYVSTIGKAEYRLTAKGCWSCQGRKAEVYLERLGRVFAVMKAHVKGRRESKVVDLRMLATESNEPEGLIVNIIESRASSLASAGRYGAMWFKNERGRLVEISLDFNMEPIDITAALTIPHLETIQELEERLERVEEERAQYHCPIAMLSSSDGAHKIFLSTTP
jgi:hypothetical protein